MRTRLASAVTLLALAACKERAASPPADTPKATTAVALAAPPAGKPGDTKEVLHGVEVSDPYRWLEASADPAVKAWTAEQTRRARAHLDLLPGAAKIHQRLVALLKADAVRYDFTQVVAGRVFAMKRQPDRQQPFLVVLSSLDAPATSAQVVLDPAAVDPSGKTSIDWFVPSPDGKRVAISLSSAGTESGDVTVYEVDGGKVVDGPVPRVNGGTAGGDLAWALDGQGYYYTRYPRGEERPAEDRDFYQQLYFHPLGQPTEKDRPELTEGLPRIAEILVEVHSSGRVLATVQNGDGGEFAHYVRGLGGKWQQISRYEDQVVQVALAPDDFLYFVSRAQAPKGRILRTRLSQPAVAKAEEVVPEGGEPISVGFGQKRLLVTAGRVFAIYQLGGPSEVRVFDRDGKRVAGPTERPVSRADQLTALGGDEVLFQMGSFIDPSAYLRFDGLSGKTSPTTLANGATADFSSVRVERAFATSKDGTQVPYSLLLPKSAARDGTTPVLVTGYGGYGVSLEPYYGPAYAVPLEAGVAVAIAHLRGGGEFGARWHQEGRLTKKQNVFDDFIAVLEHLAASKLSSAERIGIYGGSNGGLLMGAALTQRPALMKAVVSSVGIYDMLRFELSPNGAFNVTEFGSVKDEAQFRAMYAYSPYHHVVDGTRYPALLLTTGENDPRVDPMHSRKMCARLQAASPDSLVLLRAAADTGHGGSTGLDQRIAELTDLYSFFFAQLGVEG